MTVLPPRRREAPTPIDASVAVPPRLLRLPGVYAPQRDTWLLAEVVADDLADAPVVRRRVLELGTGTGALATLAAGFTGAEVTAVDVCRRALASAWLNARARGRRVSLRRGDLAAPVVRERFDLVVSNPPYVPGADDALPRRGCARAWDGGRDGRALLDRVCTEAPRLLRPGGRLLIVQSTLSGPERTGELLREQGLAVDVAARCRHPFGPVLRSRADLLERRGLVAPGDRVEELVVLRGRRPEGDDEA